MSDKVSVDQYGRKVWDVKAYANESKSNPAKNHTKSDNQPILNSKTDYISHRDDLLNQSVNSIKKHTIISAGTGDSSKTSKRDLFGFSCPVCCIAFRDTMSLVDHLNTPQHIEKVKGTTDGVLNLKRASVQQVKEMLQFLAKKRLESNIPREGFRERVQKREAFENKKREMKRLSKAKSRERKKAEKKANEKENDFMSIMGFSSFSSTKK